MPRLPPWLALTASAVALAGCGSSGASQSSAPTTSLTATSPAALAQAINLRAGDVPGFKADASTPAGTDSGPLANGMCAVQAAGALASASSPTFRNSQSDPQRGGVIPGHSIRKPVLHHGRPLYTLSSLVLVDSEAAEAETQLLAAIATGAKTCLRHVRKGIGSEHSFTPSVTVATIPMPVPGLPIYGLRRTECIGLSRTCGLASSEDRYFFAVGRVLVALQASSSSGSFPTTLTHRLLTLLYQRAQAHTP
jgi:hypothetical protein